MNPPIQIPCASSRAHRPAACAVASAARV